MNQDKHFGELRYCMRNDELLMFNIIDKSRATHIIMTIMPHLLEII